MNAGATANEQTVVITRQRGPARVPVEPRLVRPQKQRIALHRPVLKSAIITFNQRVSSAPCLVRDLSSTGARLRVEGTIHVPNSFDVIIDLDAGLVRTIAQGMLADHDMAQAQDQPNASRRLLSTRQARPDRGRTYAQPLQQLTPSSALAKQCGMGMGRSFPPRLLTPYPPFSAGIPRRRAGPRLEPASRAALSRPWPVWPQACRVSARGGCCAARENPPASLPAREAAGGGGRAARGRGSRAAAHSSRRAPGGAG